MFTIDPEAVLNTLAELTGYVTLHDGSIAGFWEDEAPQPIIAEYPYPEIARTVLTGRKAHFANLPECDANHVAFWAPDGRFVGRTYCFPLDEFPEWYQTRHIPEGGNVEVTLKSCDPTERDDA